MIKLVWVWIGVALVGVILVAGYWSFFPTNTTKQTLETFGLVGTWSFDCAGKARTTVSVPPFRAPTIISTNGGDETKTEADIRLATLVTQDKLKIVIFTTRVPDVNKNDPAARQQGELWVDVYERFGKKLRVIDIEREDGNKIIVKDGFAYQTKAGEKPTKTLNFMFLLEKCLN
jgi:hypothetical protein